MKIQVLLVFFDCDGSGLSDDEKPTVQLLLNMEDQRNFSWNTRFQSSIEYLRLCESTVYNRLVFFFGFLFEVILCLFLKRFIIEGSKGSRVILRVIYVTILISGKLDILKVYYELSYLGRDFLSTAEM